jgi:hypothetical protein
MPLSRNEPNPLSVLGYRKLNFIPQHFSKLHVDKHFNIKLLDQWINYHLNSRYAIKKTHILNENNKIIEVYEIGVEDPKELTMLTLGCPYLHSNTRGLF